jgi:hypothetical protein
MLKTRYLFICAAFIAARKVMGISKFGTAYITLIDGSWVTVPSYRKTSSDFIQIELNFEKCKIRIRFSSKAHTMERLFDDNEMETAIQFIQNLMDNWENP